MELGLIRKIDIDHEMQQSYLDYAMSVIVSRALPDARDGLKPVQRRILYAMYDMGLRPDSGYKKSARIVGEVLGKYHPHGDMAVYETMARLAQDFSMRCLLVDGQGNFGSIDGDPPAAMRYTEARLTAPAIQLLKDIEKNTVDYVGNFDETLTEPVVLPAALPNLLVNGGTGIAVGMATNIPPHNLCEVVDALNYMLQQWDRQDDINVDDLMRFIKGPDFPTGGIIIQDPQGDGLTSAYGSGRGKIVVQARTQIEEMGRGRSRIIVTELPYMTNKASLIERIAELVRDGHLEGIADLRDESDRQGMRIVIELKQTADPQEMLRELYQRTPMKSTFSINMLALVDGEPRLLSLKQALRVYLEHRLTVIRRRSEFELEKARQRAHILEGLRVALKNLDEVISIIRNSADVDIARSRLMKRFKLSELQTQAILDMPLRRLAALERKKIELEYKELMALIKDLEGLLKSPRRMRELAASELNGVKQAYGDKRRTQVVNLQEGKSVSALLTTTDVLPEQIVWVAVSEDGVVFRTHEDNPPRLSGRDAPRWAVRANTHHTLYLVSEQGQAAAVAVHSLPEAADFTGGLPYQKISPLRSDGKLGAVFTLPPRSDSQAAAFVTSVTRGGLLKKSDVLELPGPSAQTFTLAKVNPGDNLGWVFLTREGDEILLVTAQGMAIRFSSEEVRPMGLVAAGVAGIKLAVGDEVIGAELMSHNGEVLLVASDGKGKRVACGEFPLQGRYGQGVIAWKCSPGVRLVGVAVGKGTNKVTARLAKAAAKIIRLDEAPLRGRSAGGQMIVEVKAGDALLGITQPRDGLQYWNEKPAASSASKKGEEASSSGARRRSAKAVQLMLVEEEKKAKRIAKTDESKVKRAAKAAKPKAAKKPASANQTEAGKSKVSGQPVKPATKTTDKKIGRARKNEPES